MEGMTMIVETTLLELIEAIQDGTDDDTEVVATVTHLVNSGRVALCGIFRGARIDLGDDTSAAAA
jgi:hypothetical protein